MKSLPIACLLALLLASCAANSNDAQQPPEDLYAKANAAEPTSESLNDGVREQQAIGTCAWRMTALPLLDLVYFGATGGPLGAALATVIAPVDVLSHKKELCNPNLEFHYGKDGVYFMPKRSKQPDSDENNTGPHNIADQRFEEVPANQRIADS